jgi:predicted nucleic acid-binding protein
MTIIVDTNILISASLNARGELFQILTNTYPGLEFVAPYYSLKEIVKHQTGICKKLKKSVLLFQSNLSLLLNYIVIVPDEYLSEKNMEEAETLTTSIDIDDTIFVAFAMALDCLFWTGDLKLHRVLRRKGFMNVILTKDLKQILKGL